MEKYILIDSLKRNPFILKDYVDFQDDEEIVKVAVKKNGLALKFASSRLQNNYNIVMTAVSKNGLALEFASEDLRGNFEIVYEAVKSNGLALQYASNELKSNKEVVLYAIKSNGLSFRYASRNIIDEKEVILEALNNSNCYLNWEDDIMKFIPDKFYNDKDVMMLMLDINTCSVYYASDKLLHNKPYLKKAVKNADIICDFIPNDILYNKKDVLPLLKVNGEVYRYLPEELKNDKELALIAMKAPGNTIAYENLSFELRCDYDILRTLIFNLEDYDIDMLPNLTRGIVIPEELINDDKCVKEIVNLYRESITGFYNDDSFWNDKRFIIRVIQLCGYFEEFEELVSEKLLSEVIYSNACLLD